MNMIKNIFLAVATCSLMFWGCDTLEGDNSDFDFEDKTAVEDPSRLPNSIRLATYNTHHWMRTYWLCRSWIKIRH